VYGILALRRCKDSPTNHHTKPTAQASIKVGLPVVASTLELLALNKLIGYPASLALPLLLVHLFPQPY
jgi:hypothetical protein